MNRKGTWGAVAGIAILGAVLWWLVSQTSSTVPGGSDPVALPTSNDPKKGPPVPTGKPTAAAPTKVKVAEVATPPNEVAKFGWGSGEGNLGRSRPDEANPEAPMSLTVDAAGNAWVLDQVNDRLVKLDRAGKAVQTIPLTVQGPQDVAVTADGKVLVLDRLIDKSIAVIGPDGKPLGELPISGKGLEETGGVTGLFTEGDSVYVEREHGDSIRVGDTSGKADPERPEVPGRPGQDGRTYLTAGIVDAASGLVMINVNDAPSKAHRFTRQLVLGAHVVALNALDTDRSSIIYLGTVVETAGSTPEQPKFGVALLCLDPLDGRILGQATWPANAGAEETFREMSVLPEGGVVFLERTEQGSRLVKYACAGGP